MKYEYPNVLPESNLPTAHPGNVAPGSPEERAMLERVRAEKAHVQSRIGHEAMQGLLSKADAAGFVRPEDSRDAHAIAVEHVTAEHDILVGHDSKLN